jgi:hypothetical protein
MADHMIEGVDVFIERADVLFNEHLNGVTDRFWACGTSLNKVADFALGKLLAKNQIDIKIVLPDFSKGGGSHAQLVDFNEKIKQPPDGQALPDQVAAAKNAYDLMLKILAVARPKGNTGDRLRLYDGVMYQNITVFDDIAYISFYDASGIGDQNITLCCQKGRTPLFSRIEGFFEDMWNASL